MNPSTPSPSSQSPDQAESTTTQPPASPVIPNMVSGAHVIHFRCRQGIACWNACCSNIDIALTPYDILRLKTRLGQTSDQFLRQYTFPYEMEKDDIAGVKLRHAEGTTACPFMTPEGCGVYTDRPTACRYYPVALLSLRKQGQATDENAFALVNEAHCQGHQEDRAISIDDYRQEQGVATYDELARGWRQLVLKKKSSGPTVGKPSLSSRQLFFMACFDLDRFRVFVESSGFAQLFKLTAEEREKILGDETELLQFSFRFLRQVLFGENSIPLDEQAVAERERTLHGKRREAERQAAQDLASVETGDMPDGI